MKLALILGFIFYSVTLWCVSATIWYERGLNENYERLLKDEQ